MQKRRRVLFPPRRKEEGSAYQQRGFRNLEKKREVFYLVFFPGKDILRRKKIHFSLSLLPSLRDLMKISKGAAVCQKAREMCDAKNASCTMQHAKIPD